MKIKFLVTLFFTTTILFAQSEGEWYKKNPDNNIIGIGMENVQDFLKNKKVKKTPIVAVLTTGIDYEHEYLINSIWKNPKEKEDGKDNDKNGYIDDFHGWNFLGSPNGEDMMSVTKRDGDREWLRLSEKYAGILEEGGKYIKYIDGKKTYMATPENIAEYNFFKSLQVEHISPLGSKYNGYANGFLFRDYINIWDSFLTARIPDKKRSEMNVFDCFALLKEEYMEDATPEEVVIFGVVNIYTGFSKQAIENMTYTWENVFDYFSNAYPPYLENLYKTYLEKSFVDNREEIVGDDPLDFNDRNYGNNMILTPSPAHGTAAAGLVVSICPQVKIMPIVAFAETHDPYVKDLSNAIRYAVDNNADIIVTYVQSNFYPEKEKSVLAEAVAYAQQKGVLIITPTRDFYEDMNQTPNYPSEDMDPRFTLDNILVVANSDSLGYPSLSSNHGVGKLDLLAPGISLYTSMPGDLYQTLTNSFFGASVTAGVAALIKAYNPKLTPKQIRNILRDNVTSRSGVEVEKGVIVKRKIVQDTFLMENLCTSSGILNADKAVRAAFEIKQ